MHFMPSISQAELWDLMINVASVVYSHNGCIIRKFSARKVCGEYCVMILVASVTSFLGVFGMIFCWISRKVLWISYERFYSMRYAPLEWCGGYCCLFRLTHSQSVTATIERTVLAMKFINGWTALWNDKLMCYWLFGHVCIFVHGTTDKEVITQRFNILKCMCKISCISVSFFLVKDDYFNISEVFFYG